MNFHSTTLGSITFLTFFAMLVHHAGGHGRLMEPPARNAMWRFGFPNPVNYNDNGELLFSFQVNFKFLMNPFFVHRAFLRWFCG